MNLSLPHLEKAVSRILFYGSSSHCLIGSETEQRHAVLLVEHQSAESFISCTQNKDYLQNLGHRTAALEDARLLPIKELKKRS